MTITSNTMENMHGVDVSWIHNASNKDPKVNNIQRSNTVSNDGRPQNPAPTSAPASNGSVATPPPKTSEAATAQPRQIPTRPGLSRRTPSQEKMSSAASPGAGSLPKSASPGGRRNSWLSSISSKFSSSPSSNAMAMAGVVDSPAAKKTPLAPTPEEKEPRPSGPNAPKNAILPHGQKPEGNAPYTPVPPKSGHPNFITSALRRLSSSSGQLANNARNGHGGICPRKILNVDCSRERCQIPELDQSKLKRVAFCVDVEIASGPRYHDDEETSHKLQDPETSTKKKLAEKGEAEALKHPQELEKQKETDGVIGVSGEHLPKEPETEGAEAATNGQPPAQANGEPSAHGEGPSTKKKEKKKRSEEERKARKEKKRKLAEENGTIPVELTRSDTNSSTECDSLRAPKSSTSPTTDPARIYRRCCQLRETPILKKITEQLTNPLNLEKPGYVTKLDLSDLWLQLPDLITLGDYLAVVPIKELVMENCGLTDEGVRVILAGLLAAASPEQYKRRSKSKREEMITRRGAVQRLIFKNNPKIGRDGWRYISLFVNMSRSLRCLDVSLIPFPQPVANGNGNGAANSKTGTDPAVILSKALATRLAGPELELLNMAATGLTSAQIGLLCDGIIKSRLKRFGLAENGVNAEGVAHICRYLRAGFCEGLDLGANDMDKHLETLAEALDEDHPLFALSLANCALTPESLWKLFPALAKLKNFRFIDLSNNHDIFAIKPSAVYLLRKYLPKMPMLKRIHLTDCALSSEQVIALAEIFPDAEGLAHVNLLENPELVALADAKDEANQEEAVALYASLMAAVRVSKTLVAIDIDMPSAQSSEVVKALAKQVVAYSLRNMERGPITEIAGAVDGLDADGLVDKEPEMPEVLAHLVGRDNNDPSSPTGDDEAAPDEDYVIGGTGVVKALGICLKNRNTNSRRPSIDRATSDWDNDKKDAGKAKDMSKNLLGSARKIRARLEPALLKEARVAKGSTNYHKLLSLDQTLERIIGQFEAEYPETRADPVPTEGPDASALDRSLSDLARKEEEERFEDARAECPDECLDHEHAAYYGGASDDEYGFISRPMLSRHNSDVSLASRAQIQEEGRMHRFGMKFRRDIVNADSPLSQQGNDSAIVDDAAPAPHPADGHSTKWAPHLEVLRAMLEEMGGEEMKRKIEAGGQDVLLKELGEEAGALRRRIIEEDPGAWERFREAQEAAMRNSRREDEVLSGGAQRGGTMDVRGSHGEVL